MSEFHEDHNEEEGRLRGGDKERSFVSVEDVADTDNSWETFGEEVPAPLSQEEERVLRSAVDKARSFEEEKEIEQLRQEAVALAEESLKEESEKLKQERAAHPAENPRTLEPQKGGMFKKLLKRLGGK